MAKFLLPYNFVTATGKINGVRAPRVSVESFKADSIGHFARHDLWQKHTRSGSILIRLTSESPTCIGGMHKGSNADTGPNELSFFRKNGRIGVPGNSLRGAISCVVEALSQSSLRVLDKQEVLATKRNSNGNTWTALENIDPDLAPFNKKRTQLTPAELLFGVVSDDGHAALPALASRVYFSDAVCREIAPALSTELLQILSTPKPLSPFFYYSQGTEAAKDKADDLKFERHVPNGYKRYVHQFNPIYKEFSGADAERNNQRTRAEICPVGTEFWTVVRFENLEKRELELLLTGLQPDSNFRLQLGHGKPLGMGRMRLDVLGIVCIDRMKRYSIDGLKQPRTSISYRCKDFPVLTTAERSELATDCGQIFDTLQSISRPTKELIQANFAKEFRDVNQKTLLDNVALQQLKLIGKKPDGTQLPVSYPRNEIQFSEWQKQQPQGNFELFKWAKTNKGLPKNRRQVLGRVERTLPDLDTN